MKNLKMDIYEYYQLYETCKVRLLKHVNNCFFLSFSLKANLNVHLRKHTGEKFSCQHCNFSCLSPGHLKVLLFIFSLLINVSNTLFQVFVTIFNIIVNSFFKALEFNVLAVSGRGSLCVILCSVLEQYSCLVTLIRFELWLFSQVCVPANAGPCRACPSEDETALQLL